MVYIQQLRCQRDKGWEELLVPSQVCEQPGFTCSYCLRHACARSKCGLLCHSITKHQLEQSLRQRRVTGTRFNKEPLFVERDLIFCIEQYQYTVFSCRVFLLPASSGMKEPVHTMMFPDDTVVKDSKNQRLTPMNAHA